MGYVGDHTKIKKAIVSELGRGLRGVDVNDLSKKLEMDPRTVKNHLDIMEMDGYGFFVNDKQTVFCPLSSIKKMLKEAEER